MSDSAQRPPVKLGVLISGEGTNLQAMIDAVGRGELRADIRVVISNKARAGGLERARRHGIPAAVIDHRSFASREDFDRALIASLLARDCGGGAGGGGDCGAQAAMARIGTESKKKRLICSFLWVRRPG